MLHLARSLVVVIRRMIGILDLDRLKSDQVLILVVFPIRVLGPPGLPREGEVKVRVLLAS